MDRTSVRYGMGRSAIIQLAYKMDTVSALPFDPVQAHSRLEFRVRIGTPTQPCELTIGHDR